MNLVLLSGGSGQRLWPLSNDIRSKQFIKIFHREDGELESMVQRVYRQIKAVDTDATVTIATSKSQVSAIHNQLGEEVGISVEPCRRDTFPAIALAAAYLKDVQGVGEKESVVVCPVDPYAENDYFETLKALGDRAAVSSANLVLMGIEPTYPSEKYGYIIPIGKEQLSKVSMFKEKPTQEVAKDYIAKGALWNGGVFAFKLGYVLKRAHELIDFVDYKDLFNKYDTLNKISFDYAVVEHEPEIEVMRFAGTWKDLGTWNTLTEAMDSQAVGEALFNEKMDSVADVLEQQPTGKTVAFFYITSSGAVNVRKSTDYVAKCVAIAGGDYVSFDESAEDNAQSTINIQMESFYHGAVDADVLIYNSIIDGELHTLDELVALDPLMADFKAVKSGNVWCLTKNFYQESLELSDLILDVNHALNDAPDTAFHFLTRMR